jgi:glucokinase
VTVIIAGDVGGTKCNLALYKVGADDHFEIVAQETFASRDYSSLEDVSADFLSIPAVARHRHETTAACFGIAGPVIDGTVRTTNLPWVASEEGLTRVFESDRVALINDLEATGHGVLHLLPDELVCLNQGRSEPKGHRCLIAAGTGLGEALLVNHGGTIFPIPSEGGHCSFAPTTKEQSELLAFLSREYDHVSYERVLSGPGLMNIYRFVREDGTRELPEVEEQIERADDPSAAVSTAALRGASPATVRALGLFISVYGAETGNLALKAKALGGVYVGGGIAPKIRGQLENGAFLESFLAKGRMRPLLEKMPLHLVLNPKTALLGAAVCASEMSRGVRSEE